MLLYRVSSLLTLTDLRFHRYRQIYIETVVIAAAATEFQYGVTDACFLLQQLYFQSFTLPFAFSSEPAFQLLAKLFSTSNSRLRAFGVKCACQYYSGDLFENAEHASSCCVCICRSLEYHGIINPGYQLSTSLVVLAVGVLNPTRPYCQFDILALNFREQQVPRHVARKTYRICWGRFQRSPRSQRFQDLQIDLRGLRRGKEGAEEGEGLSKGKKESEGGTYALRNSASIVRQSTYHFL